MEMKVNKLTLKNFMQHKRLEVDFKGSNMAFSGMNGVGKTTAAIAFKWCLTGKDQNGSTELKFGIKPKINEVVQHNLISAVESIIEVDGRVYKILREFMEVYTKTKGTTKQQFKGHTTNYYIDDEPLKEKEFNPRIEKLLGCNFGMYSDPMYFSNVLTASERRDMLIETFGDVSDEEIIKANKKLAPLSVQMAEDKTVDQIKATCKNRMKLSNESLKEIPSRIDELKNSMELTVLSDKSLEELQLELAALEELKTTHMGNIAAIKANKGTSKAEELIKAKTLEIEKLKMAYVQTENEKESKLNNALNAATHEKSLLELDLSAVELDIERIYKNIQFYNEQLQRKRDEIKELGSIKYKPLEVEKTCPTCGQDIPAEKISEALTNDKNKFNTDRANKLATMQEQGKKWSASKKEEEAKLILLNAKLEASNDLIAKAEKLVIAAKEAAVNREKAPKTWLGLSKEVEELKAIDLNKEEEPTIDLAADDKAAILVVNEQMDQLNVEKANINQHAANNKRIKDLEEQEAAATEQYETNEAIYSLCEIFIHDKMNALTDKINSKFKIAKFKLFDVQINGGIKECCVAIGENGVAWDESLNTGQRSNIGIDIIETFGTINNITLPLFIDNLESITKLQDIKNQVITFEQVREQKTLKIEKF